MSRNVEFRDGPHPTIRGIRDEVLNVRLRIEVWRRTFVKLRIEAAFYSKALIVTQMQMENVQLHKLHRVYLALEGRKRHEVPRDIDHDATPHETGSVIDHHCWNGEASRHVGNGLSQRRQATQHTHRSISRQHNGIIFDGQRVTLTRI